MSPGHDGVDHGGIDHDGVDDEYADLEHDHGSRIKAVETFG